MSQEVIQPDVSQQDILQTQIDLEQVQDEERKARRQATKRLLRYTVLKLLVLFFTVAVGVYITVLVANMGGYVDEIRRSQIRESVTLAATADKEFQQLPAEEKRAILDDRIAMQERRYGLDQPFILRSFSYLTDALTLRLGFSEGMTSDSGSRQVRNIILERLPSTLVLFGTANLLVFFVALFFGLALSRSYGSFADKLVLGLAPTSAAPAWFYGLFLILIFAGLLRWLPFGGMVSAPPADNPIEYGLSVMKHMTLPVIAVMISAVFITIYNWRTFFLIYSSEDYVQMQKQKDLPTA